MVEIQVGLLSPDGSDRIASLVPLANSDGIHFLCGNADSGIAFDIGATLYGTCRIRRRVVGADGNSIHILRISLDIGVALNLYATGAAGSLHAHLHLRQDKR